MTLVIRNALVSEAGEVGREALALAQSPIALLRGSEWLTPLIAILPAKLFFYDLTRAKGFDTEAPRTIHEVTETH